MHSIRILLTAVTFVTAAAATSACSKHKVGVRVDCEVPTQEAVECTVEQTQGKDEIEACWDFEITCANGEVVGAPNTCTKVKDGGKEKVTIGRDKLTNADKCGGKGQPTAKVSNLTINGKKAE
ncbi:MAG TPA: hypothetical protein VL172_05195 [Kofleriaceae bacterium]|jgi:hypothetical protein|nr:hypothetical protein [Kofleriaceae bacterium]